MSMKKVVVFSTTGKSGVQIETDALNWEQLKKDLDSKGVSHSGMKAVVGQTKVTLENPEAVVPEGDFNLFLFPVKTKSGAFTKAQADALSYPALREAIKDAFTQNAEGAAAHFNDGKNYTNKSTQTLKDLLATYKYPKAKASATKTEPKAAAPSKAVKALPSSKSAKEPAAKASKEVAAPKKNVADVVSSVAKEKVGSSKTAVAKVAKNDPADEQTIDNIVSMIKDLPGSQSDKDFAIKSVLKLKVLASGDALDTEALNQQAKELAKGFKDINY